MGLWGQVDFFLSISLTDIDLYIYRHTVWIDALRYEKFKGQVLDSMKVTLKMVFSPQIVSEKNPNNFYERSSI